MIIIIGLPRSGTTMLGKIFSESGQCDYLEEPNVIWRYSNFRRYRHDEFSQEDARPEIVSFIRKWFRKRAGTKGVGVLVEKTPANVLRVDFVHKVFPDARFIFLQRPASDVKKSIIRLVSQKEDRNAELLDDKRILRSSRMRIQRFVDAPNFDKLAYVPMALNAFSGGLLFQAEKFWGPRPKSWKEMSALPLEEMVSRHVEAMSASFGNALETHRSRSLKVDYSDIVGNPQATLRDIEEFAGISLGSLPTWIPNSSKQ
ncbi:sulfotransferase family protein [Aliiruegeria sabulilitoris]|uniref:sulfotransferase family protein n=1 Tax=Aliiruegeria sabulilitoris TaxID=1510458 RepID=UPI0013D39DF3|nr:sulfotransferase [Aliiruegeria sabulilitoris]